MVEFWRREHALHISLQTRSLGVIAESEDLVLFELVHGDGSLCARKTVVIECELGVMWSDYMILVRAAENLRETAAG